MTRAQLGRAGLLQRPDEAIAIYYAVITGLAGHADKAVIAEVERARAAKAVAERSLAGKP